MPATGGIPATQPVSGTVAQSSGVAATPVRIAGVIGASVAQLGANALSWGCAIKADDDNTGSIYLGFANDITANAGVSTSGARMKAGQSIGDLRVSNTNLIWLIGSAAGQNYVLIGV